MSQTYFNYTSKLGVTKAGLVPVCTIAIRREYDTFYYGVAICSRSDNFNKQTGRTIAENRLKEHFGMLEVPDVIKSLGEKESCLAQLYNLTYSIVAKNRKWKRRVTEFNIKTMKNRTNGFYEKIENRKEENGK